MINWCQKRTDLRKNLGESLDFPAAYFEVIPTTIPTVSSVQNNSSPDPARIVPFPLAASQRMPVLVSGASLPRGVLQPPSMVPSFIGPATEEYDNTEREDVESGTLFLREIVRKSLFTPEQWKEFEEAVQATKSADGAEAAHGRSADST